MFSLSCHEWGAFAGVGEKPVVAVHLVFRVDSVDPGAPGFV
jgi:hypothetical protein